MSKRPSNDISIRSQSPSSGTIAASSTQASEPRLLYSIERYCEEHNRHESLSVEQVGLTLDRTEQVAQYLEEWEERWIFLEDEGREDEDDKPGRNCSIRQLMQSFILWLRGWLDITQ